MPSIGTNIVLFYILFLACIGIIVTGIPTELHINFFFPMFSTYVTNDAAFLPSKNGIQLLAAAKMAVNEINNKTDGILDELLPNITVKLAVRLNQFSFTRTAAEIIQVEGNAFNGTGIDGSIGAVFDQLTTSMASFFQDADIVQIGYNPSSLLSHNNLYTHYLRTSPANAYDGKILADVIKNHFQYNRVLVLSVSDDQDSIDTVLEFTENAALLGITITETYLAVSTTTDLTDIINTAQQYDPRVIVIICPPLPAARYMEQGYKLGLIHTGVTILGTTLTSTTFGSPTSFAITTYFSNTALIPSIMKGFFFVNANLNWTASSNGQDFIRRWKKQPNTISYDSNNVPICDSTMDDDQTTYLYQAHINYNVSKPFVCSGLTFSTFSASNIFLPTGHTYDAMRALLTVLHKMIFELHLDPPFSGALAKQLLLDEVSFNGVTGPLSFSPGRTSFKNSYGIGDRIEGITYSLKNFNAQLFVANKGFATVGTVDPSTSQIKLCNPAASSTCLAPVYNSLDNSIPPGVASTVYNDLPDSLKTTLLALAIIFFVLTSIVILYCAFNLHEHAVKAAQPMLLCSTLAGCLIGCGRVIVATQTIDSDVCMARLWLAHLTFYFLIGSILAKMYRLHKIINTVGFQKVVVKQMFAFYCFLGGFAFFVIYLIILSGVSTPIAKRTCSIDFKGAEICVSTCESSIPELEFGLMIAEVLLLFATAGLIWATNNAPKKVNETVTNTRILGGVTVFFVCYVIQSLDISSDAVLMRTIVAFAYMAAIIVISISLALPLRNSFTRKRGSSTMRPFRSGGASDNSSGSRRYDKPDEVFGEAYYGRYTALEQEKQIEVCQKHMEIWRNLLVDIEISQDHGRMMPNTIVRRKSRGASVLHKVNSETSSKSVAKMIHVVHLAENARNLSAK